jgi:hypothetical protein
MPFAAGHAAALNARLLAVSVSGMLVAVFCHRRPWSLATAFAAPLVSRMTSLVGRDLHLVQWRVRRRCVPALRLSVAVVAKPLCCCWLLPPAC